MKVSIVGIGEVLWDLLPGGRKLGGAPANFTYHAHALGANSRVITRVGNDDEGREIIWRFRDMGLSSNTVQVDDAAPTGFARVDLTGNGLAHFVIQENVAWDHIADSTDALDAVRQADAICFGSLAQRSEISRNAIQKLVAAANPPALRVFDINLRQHYYSREIIEESLRLATVLKLNEDELPTVAEMFGVTLATENARPREESQIEVLARLFDLRLVALTRGPNGSLLYEKGRWSRCSSRPIQVVDTVGAGDSFTAAMVLGLLRDMDLDEINSIANDVASYVCSQAGATPALPEELVERFAGGPQ